MTQATLAGRRVDASLIESNGRTLSSTQFEVALVRDLGPKFAGTKTFIEQLEDAAGYFYEHVGQRLRAYVASPPKVRRSEVLEQTLSESATDDYVESAASASREAEESAVVPDPSASSD